MKVVVTSRETIKPSLPTPPNLRHVQLSFLDQLHEQVFSSFIYFYSSVSSSPGLNITTNNLARCEKLKKSLAETLTMFYPLAGRLRDYLFIDCNDEGVHYFQAQANCHLSQLISQPDYAEINKLLPYPDMDDAKDMLLAIQVNIFDCNGIAIAICFSRKFMDGLSMFTFVNSWAAVTRDDRSNIVFPKFDLSILFPPRDISSHKTIPVTDEEKKTYKAKSFVFSGSAVSVIRAKYGKKYANLSPSPSRVESLSAFMWSRFMVATQGDKPEQVGKCYRVVQAVNLRRRAEPPLPESCFGNLSRFAMIAPSMDGTAEDGYGLVTEMRDAVRKVDSNYVKELQEGNPYPQVHGIGTKVQGAAIAFTFTSVSKYSIYGADFGWGGPIWVTMAAQPIGNVVIFMPTRSGDGMLAVVNMKEDDLAKLEADKEFQAFVSPKFDDVLFQSSL